MGVFVEPQATPSSVDLFMQSFLPQAGQALIGLGQQQIQQTQGQALGQLTGMGEQRAKLLGMLTPQEQNMVLQTQIAREKLATQQDIARQKAEANLAKEQRQERKEIAPFIKGLQTIKDLESIQERGNLGPKVAFIGTGRKGGSTFTEQGIRDRAQYEREGKSLISLASNIQIRNQREFDSLKKNLDDPNISNEKIKGTLDGMRRLLINEFIARGYDISQLGELGIMSQEPVIQKPSMQRRQELNELYNQAGGR